MRNNHSHALTATSAPAKCAAITGVGGFVPDLNGTNKYATIADAPITVAVSDMSPVHRYTGAPVHRRRARVSYY